MNAFAKRFPQAQYGSDRRWDTVLNTKGMVSKPPGLCQIYLGADTDNHGDWLDGGERASSSNRTRTVR